MEKQDVLEPDYFYHIYNRGNNKENLFVENENYYFFLKLIKKHLMDIADMYAYCLMKNHFHLLVKIKSDVELEIKNFKTEKLSQPFSNMFNAYSKAVNKKYNREGSLFKVRFKRERITEENYLKNVIVYIHLNPLKHNFTDDFRKYPFSSYNGILSDKPTALKREQVLELFDSKENFKYVHQNMESKGNFEDFD